MTDVQDKDCTVAAQLAFELKQPSRLLAVVSKAQHILTQLVKELTHKKLKLCVVKMQSESANGVCRTRATQQ